MRPLTVVPPLEPGKPGDMGFVCDGSIVRDVAAKRVVILGGLPAVLLQVAHPMVAQGVWDHSGFERDPLARMISTLDATLVMTFGDSDQAAGKAGKIRLRHQSVHGKLGRTHGEWKRGERYSALDPELSSGLWGVPVLLRGHAGKACRGPHGPRDCRGDLRSQAGTGAGLPARPGDCRRFDAG